MSVGVAIIGSGMSAIYTRPTVMSLELIKSQASSLAKSIWYVICFVICGLTTLTLDIACSPSSKGFPAESRLFPLPQISPGPRKRDYGR
jgi:hypothetical protein